MDDLRHEISELQFSQREGRQKLTQTEVFTSLPSGAIQQYIPRPGSQEQLKPQNRTQSSKPSRTNYDSLVHRAATNPLAIAQDEQTSNIGRDRAKRSQRTPSPDLQTRRDAIRYKSITIFFLAVTGDRKSCLALQDSGMSINCIVDRFVKDLGLTVTPLNEDEERQIYGLGGEPVRFQGIVKLQILTRDDSKNHWAPFYVCTDDQLLGYQAILGQRAITELRHLELLRCTNCMEAAEESGSSPDQKAAGGLPSPYPQSLSNQPNPTMSTEVPSQSGLSHNSLDGFTNAKPDSGYASMPDAISKAPNQDDDNRSIRSILTNASRVILPTEEEDHLISAFVGDLCHDISFARDQDDVRRRISAWLPCLLKTYTLRLEDSLNSKTECDAKEFIRQQRNRISYQFVQSQMPEGVSEDIDHCALSNDGMSLDEKMARWTTDGRANNAWEPERVDTESDEVQVPPRYQEVRSFLLNGPAYQWLLTNARSSALLTERENPVLELAKHINDAISSIRTFKSPQPKVFLANISMDWDLPSFLSSQRYETTAEIAVERAITVTGSYSNAQTLTCMDYMCQTWPSSGREVVRMVQNALTSPSLSFSSGLADGTKVDMNLRSPKASIVALGSQAALVELCEQLAWLGAALRASPIPVGICLATPSITTSIEVKTKGEVPSLSVQLGFTVTPTLQQSLSPDVVSTCWHAMFRNPIVVDGFPILARHENEQGLEISLGIMSLLAEAQYATLYNSTLVLKGFCTMLVPTRRTLRSITWHFLCNEDGRRIPHFSFRERCPGWIGTDKVSINVLEARDTRHFVGWASCITRHLGTEEVKCDKINWAGTKKCSPGLAIEQKLTISISKIFGGSVNAVRGDRAKPEYVKHSGYSIKIKNARNNYVVFYDVGTQRGWLVDGASALLHLVRTQVVREPYGGAGSLFNNLCFNSSRFKHPAVDGGPNAAVDILMEASNMKHIIRREFSAWADGTTTLRRDEEISAISEESNDDSGKPGKKARNSSEHRKEIYETTCFRDLVLQTWGTLEQIYDRQIDIATTHATTQLKNPFRTKLEGYEFMDIASARRVLTRRTVELQSNGVAWTDLTKQIHAITLFGQHFGEIYEPLEFTREDICKDWRTVPWGHEYLAIPVCLMKEIKQRNWEEGEVDANSPEIAPGLLCHPSRNVFDTCGSSCKHSFDRAQQLRSSKPTDVLNRMSIRGERANDVDTFTEINGALLFGKNSHLDVTRLEQSSPQAVHKGTSFHDSGIGSFTQTSSHASSSFTSSVDMRTISQPSEPPVDITGPPPSPLVLQGAKSGSINGTEASGTTSPAVFASSASRATVEPGPFAEPIPDENIIVKGNPASHEATMVADILDLNNNRRRRGRLIAGLINLVKMKPFGGE